ncbi:class I SAM-dependent methyltransferase [Undibacterium sp. JH2W]|uniref:class I SAM-dependent methyltransferase n=1 Tax=Undibacterium sp. JH2W TaxID=3413037 RepID=UPI003BF32662
MPDTKTFDFLTHNRDSWDQQATRQGAWSQAVSSATIAAARNGDWQVHLTPGPLPADWLGDVHGLEVLCLAAAGGQQAPVLAAAGASVTVFDFSAMQLAQDRMVAERDGLEMRIEQGDMRDLSRFADGSFDCIFHPISNLYVPDIRPVWRECARVLRPGGRLLSSFYNPVLFVADRDPQYAEQGLIKPRFQLPYSDLRDLSEAELAAKRERGEAMVFGHSLSEQIAGQLEAGLRLRGFLEDHQPQPRFVLDHYLPSFLATYAEKC